MMLDEIQHTVAKHDRNSLLTLADLTIRTSTAR